MEWKQIIIDDEVYPYEVSTDGQIRNMKKAKRILKQRVDKHGYYRINLSKNGIQKSFSVHRIVAIMFIPNPHGYDTVNHINHNRLDNRVENLEWMSFMNNAIDGVKQVQRRVRCIETGKIYDTITQASEDTGVGISRIHNQCAKKGKGKFTWSKLVDLHFEYVE